MRYFLTLTCLLFITGAVADEPDFDFKSNKAKAAVQKYQDASRKSNKRNLDSLIRSLEAAFKHERTEGDFDEAIKIRDTIKALEKGADPTGTSVVGSKGKKKAKKSKARIPKNAVKWEGHRYKVFTKPMTWHVAKDHCELLGGHLASVQSANENKFLTGIVGDDSYWIDGSDEAQEGKWKYSDGKAMTYFSWDHAVGEPSNSEYGRQPGAGIEHHIFFHKHGLWHDKVGGIPRPFICEWDK